MFVCKECGELFEDPVYWKERHNLDTPPYEEMCGSPCCYGAFEDAEKCDCCEEYIEGAYIITEDDKKYCKDCYRIVEV